MTKTTLKKKIYECIDHIDDNKVLEAVYTILNVHTYENEFELRAEDINIIEERRKLIIKGKEKTYTVAEVKKKLLKDLGK